MLELIYVRFALSPPNVEDMLFMLKTLKHLGRAEAIVTGGLRSYQAAIREVGNEERLEMG